MAIERVDPNTLTITHIFEGEEVVAGGEDGQVYVASFACRTAAQQYLHLAQPLSYVLGERGPIRKLSSA